MNRSLSRGAGFLLFASALSGIYFLIDGPPARHTSWLRYLVLALLVGFCSLVGEVTWELLIVGHRITGPPSPLIRVLGVLVLGAAFGLIWLTTRRM